MPPKTKLSEKPLTFSQFIKFYKEFIEPGIKEIFFVKSDLVEFRHEVNQRFDFLFKKFEDLRQEYIVIKEQLKRFDKNFETTEELKKSVVRLKSQISDLYKRVEEIESQIGI